MIRIIDSQGKEVDPKQYRARLLVSPEKQKEVRSYLEKLEKEGDLLDFVRMVTYSENFLDEPYHPSPESLRKMVGYRTELNLTDGQTYDFGCYYGIAKMVRVGASIFLSKAEKKVILEMEELLFAEGRYGDFITYWNRNRDLRIRSKLPEGRKKILERWSTGSKNFGMEEVQPGLLGGFIHDMCCARRIGLEIPSLTQNFLEWYLKTLVEQTDPEGIKDFIEVPETPEEREGFMDFAKEFSLGIGSVEEYVLEQKLKMYIVHTHHLRRLLFDGEAA